MVSFVVGEEFSSLHELEEKIKRFCSANFVDVYRRDSRSITNAIKRGTISCKKEINNELKFYEIKYACVHGGKRYEMESIHLRSK